MGNAAHLPTTCVICVRRRRERRRWYTLCAVTGLRGGGLSRGGHPAKAGAGLFVGCSKLEGLAQWKGGT